MVPTVQDMRGPAVAAASRRNNLCRVNPNRIVSFGCRCEAVQWPEEEAPFSRNLIHHRKRSGTIKKKWCVYLTKKPISDRKLISSYYNKMTIVLVIEVCCRHVRCCCRPLSLSQLRSLNLMRLWACRSPSYSFRTFPLMCRCSGIVCVLSRFGSARAAF